MRMQCGYERRQYGLNYYLKQNEKRNEKRGSPSYAARTAQYSPIQQHPSVLGVSFMFLLAVLSQNTITLQIKQMVWH